MPGDRWQFVIGGLQEVGQTAGTQRFAKLQEVKKTAASAASDRRQCGPGHRNTAPFYILATDEGASFGQLRATSKPLRSTTPESTRRPLFATNDVLS